MPTRQTHAAPADGVFRIAVLGDFTARRSRGVSDTDSLCRAVSIDRDNFDETIARMEVCLELRLGDAQTPQRISIGELNDFHPDQVFRQLPLFAELRRTRDRLLDPQTFAAASAELLQPPSPPTEATPEISPEGDDASGAGLLDAMLSSDVELPSRRDRESGMLDSLVQEVIGPHIVPAPDPRQKDMVAAVESAIAAQMQTVLHHPDFQALEALWRGVYGLVRELETGTTLKLQLVDTCKDELAADLTAADNLQGAKLFQLLADNRITAEDGRPFSLVLLDFQFGANAVDLALIMQLGGLGQLAHAPMIAGASPELMGCPSFDSAPDPDDWSPVDPTFAEAWPLLRQQPSCQYVALMAPRVLQRLPYGPNTEPIESFDFDELSPTPSHESYLWGNSALTVGQLIGHQFSVNGWNYDIAGGGDISGLPMHTFRSPDGQAQLKPCGEAWLGERAAEALIMHGVNGVYSVANSDSVRITGIRSLLDPPAPLAHRS